MLFSNADFLSLFVAYLFWIIKESWFLPVVVAVVVLDRGFVEKFSDIVLVSFEGIKDVFKVDMLVYYSSVHDGAVVSCCVIPTVGFAIAVGVWHFIKYLDIVVIVLEMLHDGGRCLLASCLASLWVLFFEVGALEDESSVSL